MIDEFWNSIPDLDGYYASNFGRIKGKRGKPLSLKTCSRGYKWFGVADGKGGSRNVSVARSVCSAFHGPPPCKMDVDHISRARDDNTPANLSWVSRSENLQNRVCAYGEKHHHAKLTNDLVLEIRSSNHYRGFDADFAKKHGVSRETVRDARNGKQWNHAQ